MAPVIGVMATARTALSFTRARTRSNPCSGRHPQFPSSQDGPTPAQSPKTTWTSLRSVCRSKNPGVKSPRESFQGGRSFWGSTISPDADHHSSQKRFQTAASGDSQEGGGVTAKKEQATPLTTPSCNGTTSGTPTSSPGMLASSAAGMTSPSVVLTSSTDPGEDAASFSVESESARSWFAFFLVLGVVMALLYAIWLAPGSGLGNGYADFFESISPDTAVQMSLMLLVFAIVHSGGAALRSRAETVIGPRAYRVLFAGISLPLAVSAVVFFVNHRYDGTPLWDLRGVPGLHELVWSLSLLSFFFLYPSTFNLLEVAAVDVPRVHLWGTGIARITRHPQMWGQLLWCLAHMLWIGSSFTAVTSLMLCLHHAFGVWHGEKRLAEKYGEQFEAVKAKTSIFPFAAVLEGRQKLPSDFYTEFLRVPYAIILAFTVGTYLFHPIMLRAAFWLHW